MSHKSLSNRKKNNLDKKKVKYILTERDVICLIAAIILQFQAITTLMSKDLHVDIYSIITYAVITISISAIVLSLSNHKKK